MRAASTTQTCRSGTSVSARRPLSAPPSSTIVPVSAIASAQPVRTPSSRVERRAAEIGGSSASSSTPSGACDDAGRDRDPPRAVLAAGLGDRVVDCGRGRRAGRSRGTRRRARRSGRRRPASPAAGRRRPGGSRAGRPAPPARGAERRADAREDVVARAHRRPRRAGDPAAPAVDAPPPPRAALRPPVAERLLRRGSGSSRIAVQPPSGPGSRASGPVPRPRHPLRALVAPARREHARERVHREPLGAPAALGLAHDPSAQVHEHGRDVDLDRADLVAGAAQRRRPWQRRRVLEPAQLRRQDRADRARIDRLVRVPADARVHRAHVQARRAADAVQRLAADLVGEHVGAPAVEQHEVELLAARRLSRTPVQIDVYGFIRSAVEERGSSCSITSRSRHSGSTFSIPISVIRTRGSVVHMRPLPSDSTTHDRARLGDAEVRAADRDRHREELLAQVPARGLGDRRRLQPEPLPARDRALEQRRDLGPVAVDRGHEDVRLLVVAELHDQLREVGLDRRDAALLERLVEPDLVGRERLDLDHLARAVLAARSARRSRSPRRRRAPSARRPPARVHARLQPLELLRQRRHRARLDRRAGVAQRLPVVELGHRGGALGADRGRRLAEVAAQLRVGQRRASRGREARHYGSA